MENNQNDEKFQYTYSAKEQEELRRIRDKYIPKEESKMEQLRRLDASAGKIATMYSVTVGVIGALVLGIGMSLAMSDFGAVLGGASTAVGIIVGCIGLAITGIAYPIYFRVLKRERGKIAPEILRLTEELMK